VLVEDDELKQQRRQKRVAWSGERGGFWGR